MASHPDDVAVVMLRSRAPRQSADSTMIRDISPVARPLVARHRPLLNTPGTFITAKTTLMTGTDRWAKKELAVIVLCRRVNRASGTGWGCYPINYVLVVHMLALTTSAPGEGYEVFEDTVFEDTASYSDM